MLPDKTTITKAKQLISDVKDGIKLDNSYITPVTEVKNVTKTKKSNSNNNIKNKPIPKTVKEYTITYIVDDKKDSQVVKENTILTNRDIPEKEGYKVIGWYVNNKLYDFTIPVSSDLILTAKYEKVVEEGNIIEEQIKDDIIEENVDTKSNINEKDIMP